MKITSKQKKNIAKIAKKYGLKLVALFGSRATGESRKDSDYDIAILSGKKNIFDNIRDFSQCLSDFANIFGTSEDRIDLANLNKANPLLLHQVEQKAVLLFGQENDFLDFKSRAFFRFHDYAPYFEIEAQVNRELIKQYANR